MSPAKPAGSDNELVVHILEGQEERIQRLEAGYTATTSALAAGEKQFQMISDQISVLGSKVTTSIDELGKRVDGLATQTAQHSDYLKTLTSERDQREKRKKLLHKVGYGVVVLLFGAILEAAGVDIWSWFKATGK